MRVLQALQMAIIFRAAPNRVYAFSSKLPVEESICLFQTWSISSAQISAGYAVWIRMINPKAYPAKGRGREIPKPCAKSIPISLKLAIVSSLSTNSAMVLTPIFFATRLIAITLASFTGS